MWFGFWAIGPCDSIVRGTCFADTGSEEEGICSAEEVGFSLAWEEAYRLSCRIYVCSANTSALGPRSERTVRGMSRKDIVKAGIDVRRGVCGDERLVRLEAFRDLKNCW